MTVFNQEAVGTTSRSRVLLADDDSGFRKACIKILREEGFDCEAVESGQAALDSLKVGHFDLLVCDLVMPPPDGFAVIEQALQLPEPPAIVAVTGLSSSDKDLSRLRTAGGLVATKPLDPGEFSRTINKSLHLQHVRRGNISREHLEILYRVATAANSEDSLIAFLEGLLNTCFECAAADTGSVLLAETGPKLGLTLAVSLGSDGLSRFSDDRDATGGVSLWVAKTLRPLRLIGSLEAYPQFSGMTSNPGIAESLVVPIRYRSEALGVIALNSRTPGRFGPDKLGLLVSAADIAAPVLLRHRTERSREHQERLAILGQLSASIAHELNNPLAYIKANVGMLQQDLDTHARKKTSVSELGPDWESLLRETAEGVERMVAIIATMKEVARKSSPETNRFDLNALLLRAKNMVYPQFRRSVRFQMEVGEQPLRVAGDEGRILQVVMNLLVNAGQAVGANGQVVVRTRTDDPWVLAEVEDNGPGVPPEVAAQLFKPFFTTKQEGTGLGLSISRQIVLDHRGELTFVSNVGRGTCFTLRLPGETTSRAAAARPTVLVVEDDAALLRALGRVLGKTVDVLPANGADEAERLAEGKKLSLVLTDFSMPGRNGVDLVRSLRANGYVGPVAILTATAGNPEIADALASKVVDAVYEKPWNPTTLLTEVMRMTSARPA